MTTLKTRRALLASADSPRRRRAISLIRFSTPQQALGGSVKCSELKHQLARALKPAGAAAYLS